MVRHKLIWIGGLLLVGAFAQHSCTQDRLTPTYAQVGICFETEILPLVVSNCTQSTCHNPIDLAEDYDFTTYAGIMEAVVPFKPNRSELYEYLAAPPDDIMPPPPYSPLRDSQILLIKTWIEKGAPETVACFDNVACDSLAAPVSFSNDVMPILDVYCLGCHSGTNLEGGIDQSNWFAVKATVDDGSFLGSMRHEQPFVAMPPISSGLMVPSCDLQLIETWVNEGAQDN